MHTTAPERGVTIVTILEMKPPRHRDSKHVIQGHKLVSRRLGLEPTHFTVLLLKNSAVIEENLIVMKKISRTPGWRITGTVAFRYRDRGGLGKSAGRVCQAEETALRMPRGSKGLVMPRGPCSE